MAVSKRQFKQASKIIKGRALADRSTKRLLQHISPGLIAVICHDDLDELAADGLIHAGVKAVINAGQTMTGKIPGHGPLLLLQKGIPIVEIDPIWFPLIPNLKELHISDEEIVVSENFIIPCHAFTKEKWLDLNRNAAAMLHDQLDGFIDNTLAYAQMERDIILQPLHCHEMKTELAGKHVLIVVRGHGFKKDLAMLRNYIKQQRPVLIGVDGGADALLEQGHVPHLIVGDMDSVSDDALRCGAELIVHAYRNGHVPGMKRLQAMGLSALSLASCGTSEDMALLLAYDHHCEQMVTVGLHSSIYEFLEKGRQGMGSTVLVRMKVGGKLTDAKGIWRLTESKRGFDRRRAADRILSYASALARGLHQLIRKGFQS
jgi:uncharacterized membrane-anchored protein